MVQFTRTLGNVALAEFVVLAVLALWQWRRSRIRGAGWAAISFLLLAGIGLAGKGLHARLDPPGPGAAQGARRSAADRPLRLLPVRGGVRPAPPMDPPRGRRPHGRGAGRHLDPRLLPDRGLPAASGLHRLPGPHLDPVGLPLHLRRRPHVAGRPGTGRDGPPAHAAAGGRRRRAQRPGHRGGGRPVLPPLGRHDQRRRHRADGRGVLSRVRPSAHAAAAVAADVQRRAPGGDGRPGPGHLGQRGRRPAPAPRRRLRRRLGGGGPRRRREHDRQPWRRTRVVRRRSPGPTPLRRRRQPRRLDQPLCALLRP